MSVQIPNSAYPLTWPTGWPRCHHPTYSQFRSPSMNKATALLTGELRRLGASRMVVSANTVLRLDGLPYSNQRPPRDKGAAVYFVLKNRSIVLACDKWDRLEDNVYAIAKHIESIRAQDRWGVGRIEQAFAGYMALPAPIDLKPWWKVLNCREDDSFESVRDSYRQCAKDFHPDRGGDSETMTEINNAWENAKLSRGWQ